MNVYHKTPVTVYVDNGDGSLTVKRRSKTKPTAYIASFKNDEQGQKAKRMFISQLGRNCYSIYRCPKSGTYDSTNNAFTIKRDGKVVYRDRRGSVKKENALVVSVFCK